MKLIGTLQGFSAVRFAPEEANPRDGVPWPDITDAIMSRYRFSGTSQGPGAPITMLTFQNGEAELKEGKVSVEHIILTTTGIMAVSKSTEATDAILEDLIDFLDHSFQFRIAKSALKRTIISDVVVQFDRTVGKMVDAIGRMEEIVRKAMQYEDKDSFGFRRISFSHENTPNAVLSVGSPLDGLDTVEFLMERRAGQPYAENKFYSRAPLATKRHIETLKAMEAAMRHPPHKARSPRT